MALHAKGRLCLVDFNQIKVCQQILEKLPNTICHEGQSGSKVVSYGQTKRRTDRRVEKHYEANRHFSQIL
jgi:hypothetical protein